MRLRLVGTGIGIVAALGLVLQPWGSPSARSAALPAPSVLQEGSITLAISPATRSAAVGDSFSLAIAVEAGSQPVTAIDVALTYPSDFLEVMDSDSQRAGVQIGAGNSLSFVLENNVNNTVGTIDYAAGINIGQSPPTGSFTLATIRFRTKATGTATVSFGTGAEVVAISASDGSPEQQVPLTQNGTVSIGSTSGGSGGGGGNTAPTPAPSVRPAAPALIGPAGGVAFSSLAPLLRWSQPGGITQFQVQIIPYNNDGPGIDLIIGDPSLVVTARYQVQGPNMDSGTNYVLLPGMSYRWQVRVATAAQALSVDSSEWSGWTQGDFRTALPSSRTISLVSPQSGGVVSGLTPTLQWDNSDSKVFYYEAQVSKDSGFNNDPATAVAMVYWELRHGGATNPTNSYTIPTNFPLEARTTYYWRVRPRVQGDGDPVEWSTTWSFRTP